MYVHGIPRRLPECLAPVSVKNKKRTHLKHDAFTQDDTLTEVFLPLQNTRSTASAAAAAVVDVLLGEGE